MSYQFTTKFGINVRRFSEISFDFINLVPWQTKCLKTNNHCKKCVGKKFNSNVDIVHLMLECN